MQPGPPTAVSKPKGNKGPAVGTDEDEGIHVSGSLEVVSVGSAGLYAAPSKGGSFSPKGGSIFN